MKKVTFPLLMLGIFCLGILVGPSVWSFVHPVSGEYTTVQEKVVFPTEMPTPTVFQYYEEVTPTSVPYVVPASKLTIAETGKLSPDRSIAETGEQINFNATITNTGDKKKLIKSLCLNHSNGQTSGCIMNHNLEPGENLSFTASMVFTSPGRFTSWLTWSQDGVNYYRTNGGSSPGVTIN